MEQFKRAKVVMLPTNEKTNIINTNQGLLYNSNDYIGINQHLYIISDDEIKEGDWFVRNNEIHQCYKIYNDEIEFKTSKNSVYCGTNTLWDKNYCKKIIATTDTSLYIHQKETVSLPERVFYLPQPSQQFIEKYIEEYNKGNIITDILIEYEYLLDDKSVLPYWNLKVNPKDNTITIKKLKEIYTKEELCQILEKYTSFLWSEVGIHYPISLGNDAKDKFINHEL